MIDSNEYFRFRAIKAAKVSEVSEATASSDVPVDERVNFHIGNPVQDIALSSAYLRLLLNLPIEHEHLDENSLSAILEELNWNAEDQILLELFRDIIKKSAPYMPRGGFSSKAPHYVMRHFSDWMQKTQQEPLAYDLGELTGKREIIISTGGVYESLRLLFHAIANYSLHLPISVIRYNIELPSHLCNYKGIQIFDCSGDEENLIIRVQDYFSKNSALPAYLLLGSNTGEICRRKLRSISLQYPLFFVEVNDALNHQSLAREAKMMQRVLRIISPGVFAEKLKDTSVSFIAGNPEIIKVIETVQFQLKGTPSATEVEMLSFLLQQKTGLTTPNSIGKNPIVIKAKYENPPLVNYGGEYIQATAKKYAAKMEDFISGQSDAANRIAERLNKQVDKFSSYVQKFVSGVGNDYFAEQSAKELVLAFLDNIQSSQWIEELQESFLQVFLRHHPEYKPQACQIVSGSSRTGLGILGFHCGITEVVIPDLSWTYEHCFPKVQVVPLTSELDIDVDGIIRTVEANIAKNSNWVSYGAIVLNNPHNATGNTFARKKIERLLTWALQKNIFVIDDLSYQNVAPHEKLIQIATLRQITDALCTNGYITEQQGDKVITVHSLSKTDSLAGARLSVVEIRDTSVFQKYLQVNNSIAPNLAAVLLTYLFYRNRPEAVDAYWRLRNRIFYKRMQAIEAAVEVLPKDRNFFDICIQPPKGSMYPQMIIRKLPDGLSLDWIASGLARQGIGLVPLSTFARTEKGFETARTTFRLTLGGIDNAEVLARKTRRVLIDLNRLIAEEASNYKRREYVSLFKETQSASLVNELARQWAGIELAIMQLTTNLAHKNTQTGKHILFDSDASKQRIIPYVKDRLTAFRTRFTDRAMLLQSKLASISEDKGEALMQHCSYEFYKDSLQRKEVLFRQRLFDRTVHPTQMYSIKVEQVFERIIAMAIAGEQIGSSEINRAVTELFHEFNGTNIAINSSEEPSELLLDLDSLTAVEDFRSLSSHETIQPLLSFWGDWDGSNRPSGQGHSLIAAVLIENVVRLSKILKLLMQSDTSVRIKPELLTEIDQLSVSNKKFGQLLQEITQLTHQLEKRYKGILPFNISAGKIRRIGMKLHLAKDPLTTLWQHNDRLERKMTELRAQRTQTLEYYFNLNKQLRKVLYELIPVIRKNVGNVALSRVLVSYHDLMKRFVVTPRIHQKMITAQDQFAIDTTVNNLYEINEIAGKYGNPGMVLALQISMSTKPEALISLDRKMQTRREQKIRENREVEIPAVRLIPLFEDNDAVHGIPLYLNKIWEYALQSRRMNQATPQRFAEIIGEVFVAGSDLSQQIGQAAGMNLYKTAKLHVIQWLAERGLTEHIRMKMGSGEPMQRQGGYYAPYSGCRAFNLSADTTRRFANYLKASTKKAAEYAVTPMIGIFAGGDLRTYQSAVSEKLRYLSAETVSQLYYHVKETQAFYKSEILRASEPLTETRLHFKTRGMKEIERLTIGRKDPLYERFLAIVTSNFRQILYGRDEDVVGIHIISYFIARTTPPLRDRPLIRPGQGVGGNAGRKILEKIADTIPLSKYGSLLRAIAHNQSQTAVLGISQLTTGLFRALDSFAKLPEIESDASALIEDRIMPNLPVYEILQSIRMYHDAELSYLNVMEKAYPAGNSAFLALREDIDAMGTYIVVLQKELLRRHGIAVTDFFDADGFIANLLPTLRPDLAVLMQPNIFNRSEQEFFSGIKGEVENAWREEIRHLLAAPDEIKLFRKKAWQLLQEPVFQRVSAFVELAIALYSLSNNNQSQENLSMHSGLKLPSEVTNFFKTPGDDNMKQFLAAAFEYLSVLSSGMVEVPTKIVKALKEVERIIKIEEQALEPKQQELLRFYLLQIARITGENG